MSAQVIEDYKDFPKSDSTSLCLGNFDGFHRGHMQIAIACLKAAVHHKLKSLAFTFNPHPRKFFTPERAPRLILTLSERREFFQRLGFDYILEQRFTKIFSEISAESFMLDILKASLNSKQISIGENFHFGHKAKGNLKLLQKMNACELSAIEAVKENGRAISSSWIRDLIENGKIEEANGLLGYPYFLTGKVVKGAERGRRLGFPTANIQSEKECLPLEGVYACIVQDLETSNFYCAASNLGKNPTFEGTQFKIEAHLLNFESQLYGRELRIFFLKRIRNEKKFESVTELTKQIEKDLQDCQAHFVRLQVLQTNSNNFVLSLKQPDPKLLNFQPYKTIENLLSAI